VTKHSSSSHEIIVSGATVDEAIARGLAELRLPREAVSIEVLSEGSRGGLFARGREAVVRLVSAVPIDGTIAIQNSGVVVTDPIGPGRPARIAPGKGLLVIVNGEPLEAERTVSTEDRVELKLAAEVARQHRFAVELSADCMSATLRVFPFARYTIAEQEPDNRVQPTLAYQSGTDVTVNEVTGALDEIGVGTGIDTDAIAEAITRADGAPTVVAAGTPATPGRNGYLYWLVTPQRLILQARDRVDHREREMPVTVEEGTTIAMIEPPLPGRPGMDLLGKTLEPDSVRECRVVAGHGVRVSEDGTIVATRAGRPVQVSRGPYDVVRVLPLYEHIGNVDMTSGNLRVKGDLLITGDVQQGMEVSAQGSVTIYGSVLRAQVRAGGTISVHGGCIASTLIAGGRDAFYRAVLPGLAELDDQLNSLIQAAGQMLAVPGERPGEQVLELGPVLRVLTEHKFPDLGALAESIDRAVETAADPEDEVAILLGMALRSKLLGGRLFEIKATAELAETRFILGRVRQTIIAQSEETADIRVGYCEQSVVRSNGTIRVVGRGSYRSDLTARVAVEVFGAAVGGSIAADERVEVRQAGNEANTATTLQVGASGRVTARIAHPGVTVRVGRNSRAIQQPQSVNVTANTKGLLNLA
jgi:uncharacterized protein